MQRLAVAIVVTLLTLAASAQETREHVVFSPAEMPWTSGPPSIPKGAQLALLEGNIADEGIFTIRLKLPPGYRVGPHWHPAYEHVTVIEGTFWIGRGETFDEAALREVPAGGFSVMAPGVKHFVATKKEGAVIQIHAMGPWQLHYLHDHDDPRHVKPPAGQ